MWARICRLSTDHLVLFGEIAFMNSATFSPTAQHVPFRDRGPTRVHGREGLWARWTINGVGLAAVDDLDVADATVVIKIEKNTVAERRDKMTVNKVRRDSAMSWRAVKLPHHLGIHPRVRHAALGHCRRRRKRHHHVAGRAVAQLQQRKEAVRRHAAVGAAKEQLRPLEPLSAERAQRAADGLGRRRIRRALLVRVGRKRQRRRGQSQSQRRQSRRRLTAPQRRARAAAACGGRPGRACSSYAARLRCVVVCE